MHVFIIIILTIYIFLTFYVAFLFVGKISYCIFTKHLQFFHAAESSQWPTFQTTCWPHAGEEVAKLSLLAAESVVGLLSGLDWIGLASSERSAATVCLRRSRSLVVGGLPAKFRAT